MKVLLTGATGFMGRHLLRELLADGHEVIGSNIVDVDIGVPLRVADVTDPESLAGVAEGCEVVVHAAGNVNHRHEAAEQQWRVHVLGTQNMLAESKRAGVRRFVHISSSGTVAVSRDPDEIRDEHAPAPLDIIQSWPYYRSKLWAEQAVLAAEGIETIALNPSLLLGPGDLEGLTTRPVRYFLEDRVPGVPPGGLSFVDVRDVADAVALAVSRGRSGKRYLLGGANMSFAAFYGRLSRITGLPVPPLKLPRATGSLLRWMPDLGREGGLGIFRRVDRLDLEFGCYTWYVDSRRAMTELNWRPRDPSDTLRDTVADLLSRLGGEQLPAQPRA